jgi:hypothetical protein|tara:strand:- start:1250 stop:1582 length:333 start_codon:yes stop_codon:yes gene_type:complete
MKGLFLEEHLFEVLDDQRHPSLSAFLSRSLVRKSDFSDGKLFGSSEILTENLSVDWIWVAPLDSFEECFAKKYKSKMKRGISRSSPSVQARKCQRQGPILPVAFSLMRHI